MSRAGAAAKAGTAGQGTATIRDQITRVTLPCEIRIVDEERREIELCATSEAVDSYGTVFGYEASKAAFERWIGNVREMHERKAVGRRVAVRWDDAARKIYVRLRISRGAEDTWEKVKDGTLRGASIGASNVAWQVQRRADGSDVPVATAYDLVELSLVDNPSNPDALGVTFVRDAAPTDALTELEEPQRAQAPDPEIAAPAPAAGTAAGAAADPSAGPAPAPAPQAGPGHIIEDAGSLSVDDMAARIAADALARGRAAVLAGVSAGADRAEPTDKQRRLAALGAPGYVEQRVRADQPAGRRAVGSDSGPGASYDGDGDHDGNVRAAGSAAAADDGDGLAHGESIHAHAGHDHEHSGRYDDTHQHGGVHQHLDGTSHEHDHLHDHGHHDHANAYGEFDEDRVQAGHSHPHVHAHDHGHYYRVADGAVLDERLVSADQVRTFEYVSEGAFRAAGGTPGQALSAQQMRLAMAAELNAIRSLGPYSRNPDGPADAGTPANGAPGVASTDEHVASGGVSAGAVHTLDRDGKPVAADPVASTGTLDVSQEADGWTGRVARTAQAEITRGVVAEVERVVGGLVAAEVGRLTGQISGLEQRLEKIEAQPLPGGPQLRAADKVTALTPSGAAAESGPGEQLRALEALAGRLTDPQAQIAVAAEMIRLGQEARGLSPALQVMPRAGTGPAR